MIRTFLILGIVVLVAGALFGTLLGVVGVVIGFLFKVVLLGGAVYLVVRLISPATAHRLREKFEDKTLPHL